MQYLVHSTAHHIGDLQPGGYSTQAHSIHSQDRRPHTLGQKPTVQLWTGTPPSTRQLLQLGVEPLLVEEGSIGLGVAQGRVADSLQEYKVKYSQLLNKD